MDNLLPRHTIINIMIVQSSDSYQRRPDFANDINFPLLCCSFPFWRFVEASCNDLTCKTRTKYKYQGKWHYWWRLDVKILPMPPPYISKFAIKHLDLNNNVMYALHIYTHRIFLCFNLATIYMRAYRRGREERSSGKVQDSKRSK